MNELIQRDGKFFILIVLLTLIPIISALGVEIEIEDPPLVNVNNSIFWDGNAFSLTRWLDIDGGNANQNIDVTPYNVTANWFFGNFNGTFVGDGSQLTGIVVDDTVFMFTNGTNAQPIVNFSLSSVLAQNLNLSNHLEVFTINASNITTRNINVTQNSTITLGGVKISANTTFNGQPVVTFTGVNVSDNVFVDAFGYLGDGGFLDNISFVNGTVIANAFNGSQFYGGNFTGNNFTGDNAFFDFYDFKAESPWLSFNGTLLTFNESFFNQSLSNFTSITLNGVTITDWSEINYTVSNNTVFFTTPAFTGTYSTLLPETFNFEIAQIIVEPSTTTGSYRFAMYENGGATIDADLMSHSGDWNIFKSYPIDNQISLNFSGVSPLKSFDVTIKYFSNFPN